MSFEKESLKYYATALDKLDDLLEMGEENQKQDKIYRDDLMDKLNSIETGFSGLQKSIETMTGILTSVVSGNALRVVKSSTDEADPMDRFAHERGADLQSVNIANISDLQSILSSAESGGTFNNNSTNNITDSIVFTDIGDASQLEALANVFPKSIGKITKTVTGLADIDLTSISKIRSIFDEINKINQDFDPAIVSNIKDLSNSIFGLGVSLTMAAPFYAIARVTAPFIGSVLGTLLTSISESSEQAKEIDTEALMTLRKTILGTGIALALAAPLYAIAAVTTVPALALTLGGIGLAFRLFPDEDKTKAVSRSITFTAIGIAALAGAFVLWDRAPFDETAVLSSVLTIGAVGAAFGVLGMFDKNIKQGAIAVGFMSLAIVGFSIAFAASQALMGGDIAQTLIGVGVLGASIGGLALVFGLIGTQVARVSLGALAVGIMSLAIGVFGAAASYALGELGSDPIDTLIGIGTLGLSIAGLALVFGLVGSFVAPIALGAVAVGLMGLSLIPLGYALGQIMQIDFDWERMAQFGTTLAGLGVVYAGIGVASPLILAGGLAVGGIGLSLIALEKGITGFVGLQSEDLAFFTEYESDGTTGFIRLMNSLSEGASEAAGFRELAGAASIGAIGLALQSLAKGIEPFVGDDNPLVAALDNGLGETLARVIDALTKPFIAAGAGVDGTDSLVGLVFGADLGMPAAMEGARSVSAMGKALQDIATGIAPFVGDNNELSKAISEEGNLGNKIATFITELTEPFIRVGQGRGEASSSLTGLIFGNDFSMSDVENGANSVAAMGDALQSIATGIQPFVGSDNAIMQAIAPENKLGDNIAEFIGSITEPFIAAGQGASSSSLTGLIFGNDFSLNDAEEGAKAVQAMGDALQSIATGIQPFTGANNPITAAINSGVGDTIAKFITTITEPFIAVMEGESGKSSLLSKLIGTDFSISKAMEGAETVMTMGEALQGIAKGATEVNKLTSSVDMPQFSEDVHTLITSIPNAYLGITLPEEERAGQDKFDFFQNSVELIQDNIKSASKLKGVADSYESIAESFASIATSTGDMADNINRMDVESLEEFSKLLYNAKEFIIEAEDSSVSRAVESLGAQLNGVASVVSSFFDSGDDATATADAGNNRAITRQDMLNLTNALRDAVANSNQDVVNVMSQVRNRLDGTLRVQETG